MNKTKNTFVAAGFDLHRLKFQTEVVIWILLDIKQDCLSTLLPDFQLYALDVDRLPVEGEFTAGDVRKALAGHVLAEATVTGTYTLNPELGD